MSKKEKQAFALRGWQEDVVKEIALHEEKRDSERMQSLSDFAASQALAVTVAMPRASGHTFLANYIASEYPTLLVYGNMHHYKEVTRLFPLHAGTETISLYEIFFAMYKNGQHPGAELVEIRKKFDGKKVVVVDNGLSLSLDIKSFIYNSSRGIVVILGQ